MPHGGKREGAGRKKGSPNKVTAELRTLERKRFERKWRRIGQAIHEVMAEDKRAGVELTLRWAEFLVPKMQRLNIDLKQIPIEEIAAELERREAEESAAEAIASGRTA